MKELELFSLDGLSSFFKNDKHRYKPGPGELCANCQTELKGQYCYECGQTTDPHRRSILHLTWEAIEGLLHLDGRLWRTLPDLFFRPGRLNRDLLERRIARHVPPLRLFLVALLLFMFAAEAKLEHLREEGAENAQKAAVAPVDPVKIKAAAAEIKADAVKDYNDDASEAQSDYNDAMKAAQTPAQKTQAAASYQKDIATAAGVRDVALATADHVAAERGDRHGIFSLTPEKARERAAQNERVLAQRMASSSPPSALNLTIRHAFNKVLANLDLFYVNLFTWGHRLAILLLPIMGFSLGLVYIRNRKYFIYDHLLVAANMMSFLFLTNALMLAVPDVAGGYISLILIVWTPVNMFMTLRGAYRSSIAGAILKTVILWTVATFAFVLLVIGVAYVAMVSL